MIRLHPHDEAQLDWYFGPAQTLLERSTMGGMLERASLHALDNFPDPERVAIMRHWREHEPWEAPPLPLTARPRGGREPSSGYSPEEGLVSRYARISRLVRAVADRDLTAASVLALYYGDEGARWGRSRQGRLFALMPHTPSGQELLRRARTRQKGADLGLSHAEELNVVLEVDRVQPVPARRVMGERARREAERAYAAAAQVFTDVKEGRAA